MNTREAEMCLPYATIYVALDREITNQTEVNIWWHDTDDDTYCRQLADGRHPDEIKFLFILFGFLKDPGSRHICQTGHGNFQVMTLCPSVYQPWDIENGPTDGAKYRRLTAYRAEKTVSPRRWWLPRSVSGVACAVYAGLPADHCARLRCHRDDRTPVRPGERRSWIPPRCTGTKLLRRPPPWWPCPTSAGYIIGAVLPVDDGPGMGH